MKSEKIGYAEVLSSAAMFALVPLLVKLVQNMDEFSIVFFSRFFTFIFIIFYIFLILKKGKRKFYLKDIKYMFLIGGFYTANMVFLFFGVRLVPIAIAIILFNSAPIFVHILSPIMLKEQTRKNTLSLALAFLGILFVVNPFSAHLNSTHTLGIAVSLAGGVLMALMFIISKKISYNHRPHEIVFFVNGVGALILFPVVFTTNIDMVISNLHFLLFIGIMGTGIGGLIFFDGIKRINASIASILTLIQPPTAIVLAAVFLGEIPSITVIVGGALVLFSIFLIFKE